MSHIFEGPAEETKRLVPRRTTDKRGGMIEPERASVQPRFTAYRSKGMDTPAPEAGAPRKSGSPYDTTVVSNVVQPIATRSTPRADTETNPAR